MIVLKQSEGGDIKKMTIFLIFNHFFENGKQIQIGSVYRPVFDVKWLPAIQFFQINDTTANIILMQAPQVEPKCKTPAKYE